MKKSVTLYFKEGKSDKVYLASIDGGTVTLSWGRRGATMQNKVVKASEDDAFALFNEKVNEKLAKGYQFGAPKEAPVESPGVKAEVAEVIAAAASQIEEYEAGVEASLAKGKTAASAPKPMLLNEITEQELIKLIAKSEWWVQKKEDGHRVLLVKIADKVVSYSRTGKLTTVLPKAIVKVAVNIEADFIIDGEIIGDAIHAFDLLQLNALDLRTLPYKDRFAALEKILPESGAITLVATAKSNAQKFALFKQVKEAGAEGIVLKKSTAPYTAGRPNTGGNALKFKFLNTASAIVTSHHKVHRSVRVAMVNLEAKGDEQLVDVGGVTIPPNKKMPPVGSVIEVRYLYAHHGGSMTQTVFLGIRDDIELIDCVIGQLKFKNEAKEEE